MVARKPLAHHLHDYFFPHSRNNYRPHLFSAVSVAVLVFAIVAFEAGYLVQTKYVFFKTDFLASVLPGALVALTNQDRAAHGLANVTEDPLLNRAAQAAAQDMAAGGYFAHVSPDGKDPWYWLNQVGYAYSYAGENLAVNFTDSENVQTAWMESPTHRANIVKREYTHVGFGTANGVYEGEETTFVVEFFAAPAIKIASAAVIAPSKVEQQVPTPTASSSVLGSQTISADNSGASAALPTSAPTAAPLVPAPAEPSWLARLLASPLQTLIAIFTVLSAIIGAAFAIAVLERAKLQHPSVLIGGTLLLTLIGIAMLVSFELAGTVQLASGAQAIGTDAGNAATVGAAPAN
ncbi:hypothetical protein HY415_02745 [Candidatus Kaiserbacteria bacterium]|nr:hypothetical protein [Candidatus Kaiserbacteria bacterium]